ncbi:hypothetical protein VTO42DRAFT_2023 [Malbranchea cinnamomea]
MSVFGLQSPQTQSSGSFGSGLFGSQPQQSNALFGSTTQKIPQSGLFGAQGQQQPQQTSGLLSGLGLGAQEPQSRSFFSGISTTPQQQPQQQQTQGTSLFSGNLPQQQGGPFSIPGSTSQTQSGGLFPALGSTAQEQQAQFGQTFLQAQTGDSTIWTPGQGMTGVHRTVPMQIMIVRDKWDPAHRSSPFRAYTYNETSEDTAPFFQPTASDDEVKWEEALRKRPGPKYVPVLVQGFWELGKRAQRQRDFLSMLQTTLHKINNLLTTLLSRHDLDISVRIAACRRRHKVLSQRCLVLAAKTQVLKSRGYTMDESEEGLQKKFHQLERSVFDPSFNGRSEEIWARMLAIREHSKQLQQGLKRIDKESDRSKDDSLDDASMRIAKKILDHYAIQIGHLWKELSALQGDLESLQPLANS